MECVCTAESIYIGKTIPPEKNEAAGKKHTEQIIP
jgi:hypothetical protein